MNASYPSGDQLYWLEGQPSELLLMYPNNSGSQKFWFDGQPSEILTLFFYKENMIAIF